MVPPLLQLPNKQLDFVHATFLYIYTEFGYINMADDATVVGALPISQMNDADQAPPDTLKATPRMTPRAADPERLPASSTPRSAAGTPRQASANVTPRVVDRDESATYLEDESLMPGAHETGAHRYVLLLNNTTICAPSLAT